MDRVTAKGFVTDYSVVRAAVSLVAMKNQDFQLRNGSRLKQELETSLCKMFQDPKFQNQHPVSSNSSLNLISTAESKFQPNTPRAQL